LATALTQCFRVATRPDCANVAARASAAGAQRNVWDSELLKINCLAPARTKRSFRPDGGSRVKRLEELRSRRSGTRRIA
jgi:hypothetical protein